jgi:hypothetical protein
MAKVRRWTGTVVVTGRGVYGLDWFCADSKELAEMHLMHCYRAACEENTPDPRARPRVRMLDWVNSDGPSPAGGGVDWRP